MDTFGRSQPVRRREDDRFLTGQGRYVDDIAPAGALRAFVFRSPIAHAEISVLDVAQARVAAGVHLVLTAADVVAAGVRLDMDYDVLELPDGTEAQAPLRPFLAQDRVRFVGEPIALIVADTMAQARDASEMIEFDYKDLPAKIDVDKGGEALYPAIPDNVAFDWHMGDRARVDAAFAEAAHRVSVDVVDNRVISNPMEPRGCFADWDGTRLSITVNGQGVWPLKDEMVRQFGLDPANVLAMNPDVGGGFGTKGFVYPEYTAVALAAKTLGRPVRWMADRTEGMLSDNDGRDLTSTCQFAFDKNLKITAYHVDTMCNLGAYNSGYAQMIQTELFAKVLMGTYDVQATYLCARGIYTNTCQVDAYRGAGRPEAIFAVERAIDQAARELGVDPWALRRKNFIPVSAFPYLSATGETYDVGDFQKVLTTAETACDRAGFAARKTASAAAGKLRGLGLCYYIESILGDSEEHAKVTFDPDGGATIYVGTQSNGQGHETVFPRFLSDQTGIPYDMIRFVQGDSDLIPEGGGTGGSRSAVNQNNATLATVRRIVSDFTTFLADQHGVEPDDITFDDQQFRIAGTNEAPTMLEVAALAREQGRDDLLSFRELAELPGRSFPNGAHVAEVEIDPETGVTRVVKYTVVDDFGNLFNPLLVEGQIHGGVAQGIGQAITEHVVHDGDGQLLTATFMDYAMPRADDMPMIEFSTEPTPSTANIMGMKGCGEAGTVGALAAVANAVADATWAHGIRRVDMPFTPHRMWALLNPRADVAAE
jgi:aerobic carbon-monoxide dehydrogenase large subunit